MARNRLAAALLLMALPLAAAPPEVPPAGCAKPLASLQRFYKESTHFSARFRHTLKAVSLGQNEVEEGTLRVAPGARMRWQYSSPAGKLAVSDGTKTWLYLPSENQVVVQPLSKGPEAPLAVRLLSGDVDLTEEFHCTEALAEGSSTRLTLTPVSQVPGLKEAQVWVGEGGLLQKVTYTDGMGNEITLEFWEVKTGGAPDATLFRFTPPRGVKVIEAPGT